MSPKKNINSLPHKNYASISIGEEIDMQNLNIIVEKALAIRKTDNRQNLAIYISIGKWIELNEKENKEHMIIINKISSFRKIAWIISNPLNTDALVTPLLFSPLTYSVEENIFTDEGEAIEWIQEKQTKLKTWTGGIKQAMLKIFRDGSELQDSIELRQKVIISNMVYFTFFVITSITLVIYPSVLVQGIISLNPGTWYTLFLLLAFLLCLKLNSIGYPYISRILFIVFWSFSIFGFPVLIQTQPTYYFTYGLAIISTSMIIQLLFSVQAEKFTYFLLMLLSLLATLFYIDFLQYFDNSGVDKTLTEDFIFNITIRSVIFWAMLNIITFFLLDISFRLYKKNQLMMNTYKIWNSNLEKIIDKNTKNLSQQNRQLKEYAFLNSHILRAEYSRLRGLVNLYQIENSTTEKDKYMNMIDESTERLEKIIENIQNSTHSDILYKV